MKNIPKKIYLQLGDLTPEEVDEIDFNDLAEVSWCSDRIYESDIEFVLSDVVKSSPSDELVDEMVKTAKGLVSGFKDKKFTKREKQIFIDAFRFGASQMKEKLS